MNKKIVLQRRRYFPKNEVGTATKMLAIATIVIIVLCVYNSF